METPILYRDYVEVILGLCRDNGKENGNYYNGVIQGLGFRALSFRPAKCRKQDKLVFSTLHCLIQGPGRGNWRDLMIVKLTLHCY